MKTPSSPLYRALPLALLAVVAASSPAATVVFQRGDGGSHSVVSDTWILSAGPNQNMGAHPELRVRDSASEWRTILVRFDAVIGSDTTGGQVPPGSYITNATLQLTEKLNGGTSMQVCLATRSWDEGNIAWGDVDASGERGATWAQAWDYYGAEGTDVPWQTAGAKGIVDRETTELVDDLPVRVSGSGAGAKWDFDVTRAVQRWAYGTPNHGLVVFGVAASINAQFYSSEDATVPNRPKLTVLYGPPLAVPLTSQPTTVTYRHGDGWKHSETADTWLLEEAPTANAGTHLQLRVRGYNAGDRSPLIAFPSLIGSARAEGQVPPGAVVQSATLRLKAISGMHADVQAARVLRAWDAGNRAWENVDALNEFGATWDLARAFYPGQGDSAAWEAAGAQGDTDRVNSPLVDNQASESPTGYWNWDVTSAVQAWADGEANHGLILFRVGDNINAQLHSANAALVADRPLLTVTYTYTPPAAAGTAVLVR